MGKGPSGAGSWAPMAHLPTVALLLLGASVTAWDICRSAGDLPAPKLFLNTSKAQDGEWVVLRCSIDGHSPATQIVFCKDGVEVHSLKAEWGQLTYSMHLIMTNGSVGTYTCGYYHRNGSNQVRSSALSAPRNLTVTGSGSSSQAGPSTKVFHPFPTGIVLGVVAISLLLLAAATYCAVKKGACRERCQRSENSSADNGSFYVNIHKTGRVEAGPRAYNHDGHQEGEAAVFGILKVSRPNCSEDSLYANL